MPVASDQVVFQGVTLTQREKTNLLSGMKSPAVRRLSPGTKLFRVADVSRAQSDAFKVGGAAGGWWSGQKAFNKMMEYCVEQDGLNRGLRYAAREASAVLFGWSDCDLLVEAYVKKNVKVFYGKGNPQSESHGGTDITFTGWDDIEQWFIPGLSEVADLGAGRKHARLNSFGKSVIEVYRTCTIRSAIQSARSFR